MLQHLGTNAKSFDFMQMQKTFNSFLIHQKTSVKMKLLRYDGNH